LIIGGTELIFYVKRRNPKMKKKLSLNGKYALSDNVVGREIHGEFIIVPIFAGIADAYEKIYALNKFGQAIWEKLDGKRNLSEVVRALDLQFSGEVAEKERHVVGFVGELLKRKMLVKV
jgi:hypothetical protein